MNSTEALFQQLYQSHGQQVYRLCLGYTGDHDCAMDLMQDCFTKVWQHLDRFRGESSHATWLYRIAANTCLSYLRKDQQMQKAAIPEDLKWEPPTFEPMEEQIAILYRCIGRLAETDRVIITLVMEQVPQREIGETLGLTENHIGVKVHRIKQQLLSCFQHHENL